MIDEWNDGYIIEGMDRIHIAISMIDAHIYEHPAVIKAGQQKRIDKAMALLGEAYQAIGRLDKDEL